jgi:hypothetical protein
MRAVLGIFSLVLMVEAAPLVFVPADDDEGTPSDPKASCTSAAPSTPQCCFENTTAPVLGGIDVVDLASKVQGKDSPLFGSVNYSTTLNGFSFQFVSEANVATFKASPWTYAPAWGGF